MPWPAWLCTTKGITWRLVSPSRPCPSTRSQIREVILKFQPPGWHLIPALHGCDPGRDGLEGDDGPLAQSI